MSHIQKLRKLKGRASLHMRKSLHDLFRIIFLRRHFYVFPFPRFNWYGFHFDRKKTQDKYTAMKF